MYSVFKSLGAAAAMLGISLAFAPGASALNVPLIKHLPQGNVHMELAKSGGGGGHGGGFRGSAGGFRGGHGPIWRIPGGGHGGRMYSGVGRGGGHIYSGGPRGGRIYSGNVQRGINLGRNNAGRHYTAYNPGRQGNYIRRRGDYQGQWNGQRPRRNYGSYNGNHNNWHNGNHNNWHNGNHNDGNHHDGNHHDGNHHHGSKHHDHNHNYYYNGYWYDWPWWLVGTGVGLYYGGYYDQPIYYDNGDDHTAWCMRRYRSYNPATDTFIGYDGYAHRCISPYDY